MRIVCIIPHELGTTRPRFGTDRIRNPTRNYVTFYGYPCLLIDYGSTTLRSMGVYPGSDRVAGLSDRIREYLYREPPECLRVSRDMGSDECGPYLYYPNSDTWHGRGCLFLMTGTRYGAHPSTWTVSTDYGR